MVQIKEFIIEPSVVYVNDRFKVKVRVQDDYKNKKKLITEDCKHIITENIKIIRTEWGN